MSSIITNGNTGHKVLTLKQTRERHKPELRDIHPKILAHVNVNSYVKICIEALAAPKPCAEIIWVKVVHRSQSKFKGEVRTKTERSSYHGVKFLEIIEFGLKDILSVRTQDISEDDMQAHLDSIYGKDKK